MSDFKGYYCKKCHTYTRLYRKTAGSYTGTCSGCASKIEVSAAYGDDGLFTSHNQKNSKKPINIWDHYVGGQIIGQLMPGTPAKVLQKVRQNSVDWYQIKTSNTKGWVSGRFIRKL